MTHTLPGAFSPNNVPIYHVLTPGDHFSPRTGSAIPTVVHGLASGAAIAGDAERYPQRVVVQSGTYTPRYESAEAVEFPPAPPPTRRARTLDAALARFGIPRRGTAAYYAPAVQSLRSAPPGIVLAHNAAMLPWLLRDTAHKVALYAHNNVLRSFSRAEASRMLRSSARIVCVSESLAGQLRERLPRSLHSRVRVVLNGVDTTQFRPPGTPVQRMTLCVMFLGRMIADKGPDLLLEAAAALGRDDVEYLVVGSDGFDPSASLTPFEQRLRELAATVPGRVEFRPFVDRVRLPQLLQQADAVVVPSRWPDPCPLTVGETMATGVPLIAARIGGIPEITGDSGVLFAPDNVQDLATALRKVLSDRRYREDRAASGLERARLQNWAWSWRQLIQVLDEVTDGAA